MVAIGSCRLQEVMDLLIDDLKMPNLYTEGVIGLVPICTSVLPESLVLENGEDVVSAEGDQTGIGPTAFHGVRFSRPCRSKTEHWYIDSLRESSQVRREVGVKNLGHCDVRSENFLAVKFFFDSVVDVQNAYSITINPDVLSLVPTWWLDSDLTLKRFTIHCTGTPLISCSNSL
jgi:hypothetical protein